MRMGSAANTTLGLSSIHFPKLETVGSRRPKTKVPNIWRADFNG